jgi:spore germination cell wall hydrolase CwlJ-like protein
MMLAASLALAIEMSQVKEKDIQCLTEAIYYEARGEPEKGQIAVAHVIKNRLKNNSAYKGFCRVVHQVGQFSYWNGKKKLKKYRDKLALSNARRIAQLVVAKAVPDTSHSALYFKKVGVKSKGFRGLVRTVRIGNHDFYRKRST